VALFTTTNMAGKQEMEDAPPAAGDGPQQKSAPLSASSQRALDAALAARAAQEQHRRAFADFLEFEDVSAGDALDSQGVPRGGIGKYIQSAQAMLRRGERRLAVSIDDLRDFSPELAAQVLRAPETVLPAFAEALRDVCLAMDPDLAKLAQETGVAAGASSTLTVVPKELQFFVAVEGSFGSQLVSPRQLSAAHIGTLVLVEGVVTKCSLVRPQLVRSVHYCAATQTHTQRQYRDAMLLAGGVADGSAGGGGGAAPSSFPTKDADGNPLTTEYGMSVFRDHQRLTVQEMPERAPAGQLPCSVEVICTDDLCDRVKPGDRVAVCGTYRAVPGKNNGGSRGSSGLFQTTLVSNGVRVLAQQASSAMTEHDLRAIKDAAQRPGIFNLLAGSLAPSIYGHDIVKRALLLQLIGGAEKSLEGGTHLRGDINILLVGDPSCGKSQLLRFVLHTAPLAVSTTGRGSSGVGLTAAVVHDRDSNDRRLEAGAMVLADRGIVCIDEFDKMSADDRTAIHEVMEQQTVTISKAGIHASLNARCAVLAAANPVYGSYNKNKKPTENIALPDSLLSRFDLLFIFLDELTPEHDRRISDHVLRMHRYRDPHEQSGMGDGAAGGVTDTLTAAISAEIGGASAAQSILATHSGTGVDSEDEDEDGDESGRARGVFQPFDRLLHGGKKRDELYSLDFIKKYITYAKTKTPVLSDEAREYISSSYTELRQQDLMVQQQQQQAMQQQQTGPYQPPAGEQSSGSNRTLPVTARTLETTIRLATAHAKLRLADTVELQGNVPPLPISSRVILPLVHIG
jgi:DNA replication licensing factor MCM3